VKQQLTLEQLCREAAWFAQAEATHAEPALYGVDNGKTIGTYLEHKFRRHLRDNYTYDEGNSADGIDFPGLSVDMKVTRRSQPQSSCPFRSARQKIFGLGYSLLVLVYEKSDDDVARTATLEILHAIYIGQHRTGDYTLTRILREYYEHEANEEDFVAVLRDRNLPVDEIGAREIAEQLIERPPEQGYVTVSNALQWRLQYSRAISVAGTVDGVAELLPGKEPVA